VGRPSAYLVNLRELSSPASAALIAAIEEHVAGAIRAAQQSATGKSVHAISDRP
jgi:hypothetical protein